jgi:hypothetical protein
VAVSTTSFDSKNAMVITAYVTSGLTPVFSLVIVMFQAEVAVSEKNVIAPYPVEVSDISFL